MVKEKRTWSKKYAIGLDIGGTSVKCAIVSSEGKIIDRFDYPVDPNIEGGVILTKVGQKINDMIALNRVRVKGIGIGVPGILDNEQGLIKFSSNMKKWVGFSLTNKLKDITRLKTIITNDANCAALGEARFGISKQFRNSLLVTLGTGIGGGLILNGELYEGNLGQGAELGHISIDYHGRLCGCGRRGCLEAYASASALIKDAKDAMKANPNSLIWELVDKDINKVDAKVVFDAAHKNDSTALKIVENYIEYLGQGLLNYCVVFKPEAIILSGGISRQGDYLVDRLINFLNLNNHGIKNTEKVRVLIATLGPDAGVIGAASLIFKNK